MSQLVKVYLIIVNYNNLKDTLACLRSLKNLQPQQYILTPILVDNGSRSGVVSEIKTQFPDLKLIRSPQNVGFAAGNNLAIKYALDQQADYLFLINNDTLIKDPQLIDHLLEQSVDITSPVVKFNRRQQTYYDFGGKIDYLFARHTHLESTTSQAPDKKPDYLSGVSLFVASKVFDKVGLFDERFFLYYEDADFCLRAKKLGFSLQVCPQTAIYHQLSQSANQLGSKKLSILADSQWLFARKHLPKISLPLAFLYHLYLKTKASLKLPL